MINKRGGPNASLFVGNNAFNRADGLEEALEGVEHRSLAGRDIKDASSASCAMALRGALVSAARRRANSDFASRRCKPRGRGGHRRLKVQHGDAVHEAPLCQHRQVHCGWLIRREPERRVQQRKDREELGTERQKWCARRPARA